MILRELVAYLPFAVLSGAANTHIKGVTADSRLVQPGWLYVAVVGLQVDGHNFVTEAEKRGAAALLVEHPVDSILPQLIVRHTQPLVGLVAAAFQGFPSQGLRVTGITGTKGKTSVSYLLDHLLREAGRSVALLGSVGGRVAGRRLEAGFTTRPAAELQELLRLAADAGERHLVMEVGSHALVQRRVAGISFDTAIFTNLSHDHLDYHGTMERYLAAKALLFSWLGSSSFEVGAIKERKLAIVNNDDPASEVLREHTGVPVMSFGFTPEADLWADEIKLEAQHVCFSLHWLEQRYAVQLPLVGRFNIANALAALAGGLAEDLSLPEMVGALQTFLGVPGRFQRIDFGQPFTVVVDYAHTEESLRQVLLTSREMTSGRLILVFGCTGDRDRAKRPLMGALAVELADKVIVSSDDPHSEEPEAIIAEIVKGIPHNKKNWSAQVDRGLAVAEALHDARPGDFVLLAGKGHETVQIFKDYSVPYSDQDAAREVLQSMGYLSTIEN